MNFIHKLFLDKSDEETHRQFKRYGKGDYENKALIDITRSKKDVKIKTSFEFAEEFAKILANDLKGKAKVTGVVITTKDIRDSLGFSPVGMSQFAGVKSIKIDNELSKEEILKAMDKHQDALFLRHFNPRLSEIIHQEEMP